MSLNWQKGKIIKIEKVTDNIKRFWIEITEFSSFDFVPGQFVTLDLPISEKRNKRWRSYSIASAPNGTNIFELVIVHVEGGVATQYIFNELNVGSELTLRGPQGVFSLPDKHNIAEKNLFLICTGTGIAPLRSMLYYIHQNNIEHKEIYLVFGTRYKTDLLYVEEMYELEKIMPGFHYLPVLSREDWAGHTGYVHGVYESLCKEHAPATFMLCGWKAMIDEAKERILKLGYEKTDIKEELFG